MWRIWLASGISPIEIEEKWTLSLVMDANDALDIQQDAEVQARERAMKEDGAR